MSYAARTTSTFLGQPFEGYWFSCGTSHWRYASGDVPRVILGQTYTPAALSRDEIDQCQELRAGQTKVRLPLDNPVAQLFLPYLPAQPVDLVVYAGQEGDAETVVVFTGRVLAAEFGTVCELTVVPESDALKQQLPGLLYQIQCPRVLGGAGCGVDLATYAVPATLSAVTGRTVQASAFAAKPDGWFAGGWVEGPGGARRLVVKHQGSTLTLFSAWQGLASGAEVTAYPGCDGTESCCASRFGNLLNHLGCARIPQKNPFSQGI